MPRQLATFSCPLYCMHLHYCPICDSEWTYRGWQRTRVIASCVDTNTRCYKTSHQGNSEKYIMVPLSRTVPRIIPRIQLLSLLF
ncbi:hypothetical protein L226DRAFT_367421 [Lentinus tigrinus ALCF2SS1-7]|uniref:uncharacterized protein n=1 Tax=Lentinus tigrinus ALCF2SS1-7 TaxID=1328758 RepID=UPI00116621C7|nr:hypothetical protein L226DRAFT_366810 [Lentinus tigrinus ALCF2SS1-7]RPD68188.1 hypothetical protein L226DRAFT_367421 [Lentinus tigrinus ALCF2SS1-7]